MNNFSTKRLSANFDLVEILPIFLPDQRLPPLLSNLMYTFVGLTAGAGADDK